MKKTVLALVAAATIGFTSLVRPCTGRSALARRRLGSGYRRWINRSSGDWWLGVQCLRLWAWIWLLRRLPGLWLLWRWVCPGLLPHTSYYAPASLWVHGTVMSSVPLTPIITAAPDIFGSTVTRAIGDYWRDRYRHRERSQNCPRPFFVQGKLGKCKIKRPKFDHSHARMTRAGIIRYWHFSEVPGRPVVSPRVGPRVLRGEASVLRGLSNHMCAGTGRDRGQRARYEVWNNRSHRPLPARMKHGHSYLMDER